MQEIFMLANFTAIKYTADSRSLPDFPKMTTVTKIYELELTKQDFDRYKKMEKY